MMTVKKRTWWHLFFSHIKHENMLVVCDTFCYVFFYPINFGTKIYLLDRCSVDKRNYFGLFNLESHCKNVYFTFKKKCVNINFSFWALTLWDVL